MTKRLSSSKVLLLALVLSAAGARSRMEAQHPVRPAAQGYLGIDVKDVDDDELTMLHLKDTRGAEIIRVDHDGPAGKMGLREHDVVTQMNGATVDGEDQIRRMLREAAPGTTISLSILRDGRQMTLTAQMADRSQVERQAWELHLNVPPAAGPQAPLTDSQGDDATAQSPNGTANAAPTTRYSKGFLGTILLTPAYTGVMLEKLGPQLGQFFGVPRGVGLLVKSVEMNSPAAVAGVHAGDVVTRMNARAVFSMNDWAKVVREAKGHAIAVTVLRDKQERVLMMTPDAKKHS